MKTITQYETNEATIGNATIGASGKIIIISYAYMLLKKPFENTSDLNGKKLRLLILIWTNVLGMNGCVNANI